jgi:hypothetical protein
MKRVQLSKRNTISVVAVIAIGFFGILSCVTTAGMMVVFLVPVEGWLRLFVIGV